MDESAVRGLQLLIMLVFGAITAGVASSKSRNTVGWFFVGFFLGCIGLIIILCLSDLKDEAARWERSESEQRRLREQLKQERLKNEAFQGHVRARLEVHDQALRMDTRQLAGADGAPPPAEIPAPLPNESMAPLTHSLRQWRVNIESHKNKAISFEQLRGLYSFQQIDENTLVWSSGMPEWKRISQVPGLIEALI